MNDPANAALKSHKWGYLQGSGGGVALIFLLTNDLNLAGGPTEQKDLRNVSCHSWAAKWSHKHSTMKCPLSVQMVNVNWKP